MALVQTDASIAGRRGRSRCRRRRLEPHCDGVDARHAEGRAMKARAPSAESRDQHRVRSCGNDEASVAHVTDRRRLSLPTSVRGGDAAAPRHRGERSARLCRAPCGSRRGVRTRPTKARRPNDRIRAFGLVDREAVRDERATSSRAREHVEHRLEVRCAVQRHEPTDSPGPVLRTGRSARPVRARDMMSAPSRRVGARELEAATPTSSCARSSCT